MEPRDEEHGVIHPGQLRHEFYCPRTMVGVTQETPVHQGGQSGVRLSFDLENPPLLVV